MLQWVQVVPPRSARWIDTENNGAVACHWLTTAACHATYSSLTKHVGHFMGAWPPCHLQRHIPVLRQGQDCPMADRFVQFAWNMISMKYEHITPPY